MRVKRENKSAAGFSLVELLIAMTIMLVIMGLVSTLFSKSLSTRQRESSRVDALTAAQAALNVISREVSNSGYGLINNGIVTADSNAQKIHILANTVNTNSAVTDQSEDITYFYDTTSKSILRYDANAKVVAGVNTPETSIIINRISDVKFEYFDYSQTNTSGTLVTTPSNNTGRVRITITVNLEDVQGQTNNQKVILISDVSLRNSDYMLQQY